MTTRKREPVPPFVRIGSNVYVVTQWDDTREDVADGKELILRQLARLDREIYQALVRDAELEAFARTQG